MIGRVLVHTRKGTYFVQSYDRNNRKVWLGSRDPATLAPDASSVALGQAVLDALHDSRLDTDVSGRSNLTGPLLAAAAVQSYSTFTKGLKTVGVNANDQTGELTVEVTPTYKDSEGYASWSEDGRREFVYDSPGQIGQAVLDALETTTPT